MVNCINSLKITLPLFLGIQYWHYHVSAMDTKVAAPPSRTIDSLPVPCFLFSQLLTSSFFFVLFSCSCLVFLCCRLFVPIYPVAPGRFLPPQNTHTCTQDLLELIFFPQVLCSLCHLTEGSYPVLAILVFRKKSWLWSSHCFFFH